LNEENKIYNIGLLETVVLETRKYKASFYDPGGGRGVPGQKNGSKKETRHFQQKNAFGGKGLGSTRPETAV